MSTLLNAIESEMQWGTTDNGADCKVTTGNCCLDLFGRAGAMREASVFEKSQLFLKAYQENPDMAMKLLFYIRDAREGYGERDTFNQMFAYLASVNKESVVKNLWAVIEYGRAKDFYSLIGTNAEQEMWQFMQEQFELDYENMKCGRSISLLAKWIATPDSKSEKTSQLGKLTAKKLGYSYKTMREYKTKLRELRKYLDIPEAKMCAGNWEAIEYSKCGAKFMLKNREAIKKHDGKRYVKYLADVKNGKQKINMQTNTPYDIVHQAIHKNSADDIEVMWANLPDKCKGNALVMCDTSGSMYGGKSVVPMEVAIALTLYLSERNKGCLKNVFMTFEEQPKFMKVYGSNLAQKYMNVSHASWAGSTDLEAAFDLLLKTCITHNVAIEDMPDAIVVVSDMQINKVGVGEDNRLTFYDIMSKRYAEHGYKMPHLVFWNVNAKNPTFHASMSDSAASVVSGYSANIYSQVMNSIGVSPYELMLKVVNDPRYAEIRA